LDQETAGSEVHPITIPNQFLPQSAQEVRFSAPRISESQDILAPFQKRPILQGLDLLTDFRRETF
jgi:hypothetical protein